MRKILALTFIITIVLSSCKYEDGPIMSFRSKKNRVAHRIGKYWSSEKYSLKMGQTGYALSVIGQPGFIDQGDWYFNDTKDRISFVSAHHSDYKMFIKQLQHKHLKLEGAFPFDNAPIIHVFDMDKTIDDL